MLIVANVYIWDVLYKHRHSVIITVAAHFDGGRQQKLKTNHFMFTRERVCFLDHNSGLSHEYTVAFVSLNKNCTKTYTYMQRPTNRVNLK